MTTPLLKIETPIIRVDQIAFAAKDPKALIEKYSSMGFDNWVHDEVSAKGSCNGQLTMPVADLYFNYQSGIEIEILKYQDNGELNWHQLVEREDVFNSHYGMHVSCLGEMKMITKEIFTKLHSVVIQEVMTTGHSNPAIKDSRRYHYMIFDTRKVIGFDIKLIRRLNIDHTEFKN